jgi:ABC-2 type transport system ATP-binding protein
MDAAQIEKLRVKQLFLHTVDNEKAKSMLAAKGYAATSSPDNNLVISGVSAVSHPETIAEILVHSGCPPTLLKVEEEDLESYFLRMIGEHGGVN